MPLAREACEEQYRIQMCTYQSQVKKKKKKKCKLLRQILGGTKANQYGNINF